MGKSKPSLRINNAALEFNEITPVMANTYEAICKLPLGELFTTQEILKRYHLGISTLRLIVSAFPDISDIHRSKRIYGAPKTIALYRKEKAAYEAGR